MQIELFTLCDYASVRDQRLTIVDTFEHWFNLEVLSAHWALKMRFEESEVGSHKFEVRFVDEDANVLNRARWDYSVVNQDEFSPVSYAVGRVYLEQPSLKPGHYQLELVVDESGAPIFSIPLYVHEENPSPGRPH